MDEQTHQIVLRVNHTLYLKLKMKAEKKALPISTLVRLLIKERIDQNEI